MRFRDLLLIAACVVQSSLAGTIEGTVSLPRSKSAPPAASAGRYKIKASTAPAAPEPMEAVVYLEGKFPDATPSDQVFEMGQRKFQFEHSVLPVQKGGRVTFPNFDDDYHNVFSYSKPKRFDLGRYRKEENPPALVFEKPGVVKLFCEIHEHMRATILVLDTPHFVKTDAQGAYKLENIPPGNYTLKAWLDEKTISEQPVEIKEGETLKVNFGK